MFHVKQSEVAMNILTARPHRLLPECIARIGALERAGERVMLLVPAQYTLQAELEMMDGLNLPGSFLIDVLSPGRLQSRVFERAGQPARTLFDERGKRMVLSAIIEEEAESLTVYRSAAMSGAQGFVAKVSALIADLKRSGLTARELIEKAEALEDGHPARAKLLDVGRIYAGYEQRMRGELADAEDISQEMRMKLGRSGVLEAQHVFVYGFDMITPTFAAELIDMDRHSKSLTLAIETDDNAAPDGRLFAPVNFSLTRLQTLAQQADVSIRRETLRRERAIASDLAAMEHRLFALGGKPFEAAPEHIELRACSSARAEVHLAAARMRRLAAAGESLSSLAVVYPKGSGYGALLESILPMYGIRAHVAQKRPALAHPICRFVLSALAAVSNGLRTADVIECAQTGFLHLTQEQTDALSSYAEGVDLRGDAWRQPFTYVKGKQGEEAEAELSALNEARSVLMEPLLRFGRELGAAKNAEESVAAVVSLLEQTGAADTLEAMRAELLHQGLPAEAEDCAQVWTRLMETLDQLHTLLGGERASAALALNLLREGLSGLELAALPPADGAVICGEIGNVRTAQIRTLLALGMNDAGGVEEGGLLTAQEREAGAEATGAYLGMTATERAALAQLDVLKALSGATERVLVSYALADETGRALREGTAVQALHRLFPQMPLRGGLAAQEQEEMLVAPDAALEALGTRLSDAVDGRSALSARERQAYAALARSETGREALARVTRRLGEAPERRLTAAQARTLYGRPVMSVSRLETFAQCPYRHFVRYGLAPQEEAQPGVDRAELGTLYHEAAERFTQAVTQREDFPDVPQEACEAIMEEAVAPLIEAWRASPLGQSARGGAVARRIERTAKRAGKTIVAQFAGSRFRPLRTELVFGQNGVAPIMLTLADGSTVYLQGRIDRIDVLEDGGMRIRVIDYKSGVKKFDPTMAYWGIQLQLLIYLAAALSEIPGAEPAGFFYCRIADPTVKTESRIKEEVERQIAKKLSLAGISLSDVEVLRAQGSAHAAMITKDGRPSGTYKGSMTDEAGMAQLVGFARRKATELAQDAYAGIIDDAPAERLTYNACATCSYAGICGFDPAVKTRRRLSRKGIEDLR